MMDGDFGKKLFDGVLNVLPFLIIKINNKDVKIIELNNTLRKKFGVYGYSNNAGIDVLGKADELDVNSGEKVSFKNKIYRVTDIKDLSGGLRVITLDDEY